jgi:hypothetical protein
MTEAVPLVWQMRWSVRPSLDRRLELARISGAAVQAMTVSQWQGRDILFTATHAHDFDCSRDTLHDCHERMLSAQDATTGEVLATLPDADGDRLTECPP